MAGSSTTSVIAGITANGIVTVAKFIGFSFSGSGAMLSEAFHSLADTINQAVLLFGLKRSERPADEAHPYGYGRARFFWGVVSAMGIFFIGAGVSLYHGIHALMHLESSTHSWVTWAVLGLAIVLEGGALMVAWRGMAKDARSAGVNPMDYVRAGTDPTATAVILEDGAAVLGLLLAIGGITLEQQTGWAGYDAIATLLIGVLLAFVAIFLVKINRRFLLISAVDEPVDRAILEALESEEAVESVQASKSVVLTLGQYSVNAELDFDGRVIADRALEDSDLPERLAKMNDAGATREALLGFGEDVLNALGDEVNAIEGRVQERVPGVKSVDLEAD
jgi:zinc transporter 9